MARGNAASRRARGTQVANLSDLFMERFRARNALNARSTLRERERERFNRAIFIVITTNRTRSAITSVYSRPVDTFRIYVESYSNRAKWIQYDKM